MPNPQGSPLKSFVISTIILEDGTSTLKISYTYEDGFVFETEHRSWAMVGVDHCELFDQEPPITFNPETELFTHAW